MRGGRVEGSDSSAAFGPQIAGVSTFKRENHTVVLCSAGRHVCTRQCVQRVPWLHPCVRPPYGRAGLRGGFRSRAFDQHGRVTLPRRARSAARCPARSSLCPQTFHKLGGRSGAPGIYLEPPPTCELLENPKSAVCAPRTGTWGRSPERPRRDGTRENSQHAGRARRTRTPAAHHEA